MSPRRVDPGPVVAVEVSPCADNGRETYVTTPEAASFWTTYHRYESGEAQAVTDHEGSTVKNYTRLAPWRTASAYRSANKAYRAGRETTAGLRSAGVHA